jgi:hypothetical protein
LREQQLQHQWNKPHHVQFFHNTEDPIMNNAPKYPVSNEDRHLVCEEEVAAPLLSIIDQANIRGWGTLEAITVMEEVVKNCAKRTLKTRIQLKTRQTLSDPAPEPSTDWPGANP